MQSQIAKELRSDAIRSEISKLHQVLVDDEKKLVKLNKVKADRESELSILVSSIGNERDSNEGTSTSTSTSTATATSTRNWTDSYRNWKEWDDEDEIQIRLERNRQRLAKLQGDPKTGTGTGTETPSTGSTSLPSSCCRGSQFRDAERRVARMSIHQQLKHMKSFREKQGNRCFQKGEYGSALKWYEKSLLYYEYCLPSTKSQREAVDKERELALTNSAACHLALQDYRQCIESCTEALELTNGGSIKALYRRAKAYRLTHDFEKAMIDLDKAKAYTSVEGTGSSHKLYKAVHDEDRALKSSIGSYNKNSKSICQQMMKG